VLVPGDPATGWLADPGLLERARTPRTKAVIINSPVNPTGAAYDEPTMRSIRDWAADHGVYLISDDIYWAYCANSGAVRASGHEVVVGGAAKVHALAGLRIGWIWSLPQVTEAVRDVVAHTTGPVSTLAQTAVAAVLRDAGHADAVSDRAERLAALRERAVAAFSTVPMMRPVIPVGGIYVCLDASALLARRQFGAADDRALCRVLEERAAVRLRAGSTFGLPGHLRLCVAVTPDVLEEAADRLATFVGAAEMDAAETDSVRNMGVP
jgi:aspartate aminotransferase